MRPYRLVFTLAAFGLAVTALVSVVPDLRFAYRSPSLHVVVETAAALVASLAAYLVYGRFRQNSGVAELVLACSLVFFTARNVVFPGLASAAPTFSVWASLLTGALAASTLAAAALAGGRSVRRPRAGVRAVLACALAAAAVVGVSLLLRNVPPGVPTSLSPANAARPLLAGHPAVLGLQALAMLLFAVAAAGFARRAAALDDDLYRWFAAGATLGAVSRLNYLLVPSFYSGWVYVGDFFRIGFYALLLVGGAREIRGYWERIAELAVADERRRMARDLHDGLAQELAYIAAESSGRMAAAAERALDESRRAIAALTRPVDEPLAHSLVQAAEEVGRRVGTSVTAEIPADLEAPAAAREQLVRIVREAVVNAGRHGGAKRVRLEVSRGDVLRLRVVDDGTGFDVDSPGGGFGLVSMRERAQALGGDVRIRSRRGVGTQVEVVLP